LGSLVGDGPEQGRDRHDADAGSRITLFLSASSARYERTFASTTSESKVNGTDVEL